LGINSRKKRSSLLLDRKENIKDAFSIIPNIPAFAQPPPKLRPAGKADILLVDDILTTGSTLLEAARILKKNGAKLVMGEENIEYEIYKDFAKYLSPVFLKPVYYSQSQKIKKEEQQFWKSSDCCIAVLNEEAEFIKRVSGKNCFVVENGVDLDHFEFKERRSTSPVKILFVGNFTYFPNVDAVRFFYDEVYKKYDNKNLDFTIIGKNSTKLPFFYGENVHKIEYVSDIRDYYYNSDIFISPVRFGGGTNFKVLEAFGCGLPVIAYPSRIKGLGAQNHKEILLASNGENFYLQIQRLIKERDFSRKIASNAREFVEKNYNWTMIGRKLNKIWKEI